MDKNYLYRTLWLHKKGTSWIMESQSGVRCDISSTTQLPVRAFIISVSLNLTVSCCWCSVIIVLDPAWDVASLNLSPTLRNPSAMVLSFLTRTTVCPCKIVYFLIGCDMMRAWRDYAWLTVREIEDQSLFDTNALKRTVISEELNMWEGSCYKCSIRKASTLPWERLAREVVAPIWKASRRIYLPY